VLCKWTGSAANAIGFHTKTKKGYICSFVLPVGKGKRPTSARSNSIGGMPVLLVLLLDGLRGIVPSSCSV